MWKPTWYALIVMRLLAPWAMAGDITWPCGRPASPGEGGAVVPVPVYMGQGSEIAVWAVIAVAIKRNAGGESKLKGGGSCAEDGR